eukprot:scaffold53513_cov15-Tisochrysis_lutea.AAC.1
MAWIQDLKEQSAVERQHGDRQRYQPICLKRRASDVGQIQQQLPIHISRMHNSRVDLCRLRGSWGAS